MKIGEELPEDWPNLVPIVTVGKNIGVPLSFLLWWSLHLLQSSNRLLVSW